MVKGSIYNPENTKHQTNGGSMLGRRRRRRASIGPILVQCVVFAGNCDIRKRNNNYYTYLIVPHPHTWNEEAEVYLLNRIHPAAESDFTRLIVKREISQVQLT